MDTRISQFVRGLYFDVQTVDSLKPLEIWNGFREFEDPFEKSLLVKNLYKIAVPLVNERCLGLPFERHSRCAKSTVSAVLAFFKENPDSRVFIRFPYPPTADADQKELYRIVKAKMRALLTVPFEAEQLTEAAASPTGTRGVAEAVFPDGLFNFSDMRMIDNELPYIIFTDKEFRVIRGLAIVYLWLIDLDSLFLQTLSENGVDDEIVEEYRQFGRRVQKENPMTIHGKKMDERALVAHIHEKLKYEDYLDLFENVYRWFEQAREKFGV